MSEPAPYTQTHCGYVALIGAPNAGKSTLVNMLVGAKVSIVSRKVQTTRNLVRGICMVDQAQLIFVDTPGLFAPKRRLERAMVTSAWGGAGDADVIALLVDVRRWPDEETQAIITRLNQLKQPKVQPIVGDALDNIGIADQPGVVSFTSNTQRTFEVVGNVISLRRIPVASSQVNRATSRSVEPQERITPDGSVASKDVIGIILVKIIDGVLNACKRVDVVHVIRPDADHRQRAHQITDC